VKVVPKFDPRIAVLIVVPALTQMPLFASAATPPLVRDNWAQQEPVVEQGLVAEREHRAASLMSPAANTAESNIVNVNFIILNFYLI